MEVWDKETLFLLSFSPLWRMMMIIAKESGLTNGFIVGRDRTRVSLLQFANDTIFFSKASLENLENFKLIVETENLSKIHSKLYFLHK